MAADLVTPSYGGIGCNSMKILVIAMCQSYDDGGVVVSSKPKRKRQGWARLEEAEMEKL